jgi:cytoskeletal protein RodZ
MPAERASARAPAGPRAQPLRKEREKREERRSIRLGTAIALLASVAVVSVFATTAFAGVVQQQVLHEEAASYTVSASASQNFPDAPSIALATDVNGTCSASSASYPAGPANNERTVLQESVTGKCAVNDWEEILTWQSPASLAAETVHFEAYIAYGPTNATALVEANLSVATTTVPGGYTAVFAFQIDLGAPVLPAISELSVSVT